MGVDRTISNFIRALRNAEVRAAGCRYVDVGVEGAGTRGRVQARVEGCRHVWRAGTCGCR